MKNIELLAPAGDKESLIAAVQNGANAIYLGGTLFNARAFAKNFDSEELKWAVEYAHLRDVKIYVTVNTLYKDNEMDDLIEYIDYLYDIQIDALIIQDIGLFHIVKTRYPDFETHMSTQSSIMNTQAVEYFSKMGANRIVLARENTIEEIKAICQSTQLEIEVFVHGALCICYSGQCLMSSFIGKRSGNRGECAQPCRLQYKLIKDGQLLEDKYPFLLSPKDLMTIHHIGELIDAGVTSFKVEGRMKKPEYVASVIKAYRKAIDNYLLHKNANLDEDIYDMKSMFNRDYTEGFLFHDNDIMSGDYSGNKGIVIGSVKYYSKDKKRVAIELSGSLSQNDSIVFESIDKGRPVNKIYLKDRLVANAQAHDIIEIEFDYPVYKGNVRKTVNSEIIYKLKKSFDKEYKKSDISMQFHGYIGKKAELSLVYKNHKVSCQSQSIIQEANQTSISQERIIGQLSKLGQSQFVSHDINVSIDENITIPIKDINEMRRECIEMLNNQIKNSKIHNSYKNDITLEKKIMASDYSYDILVNNLEQLEVAIQYPTRYIYYPFQEDALSAFELCQKHKKEFALFLPRIVKDQDIHDIINSQIYKIVNRVVVNDFGFYNLCQDKEIILGTGLNIYNSYSCQYFKENKILSLEMSSKQIKNLECDFQSIILQIYGKTENMISDYCPISQYYFGSQKKNCQLCKKSSYSLCDRKNENFDLVMDEQCRMHLLNCRSLYIPNYKDIKIGGYFIHFTNEAKSDVEFVLEDIFNNTHQLKSSHIKTTIGYFKE
ncbi:MAG: U32 family peptidase [Coprobacillus sp.]